MELSSAVEMKSSRDRLVGSEGMSEEGCVLRWERG